MRTLGLVVLLGSLAAPHAALAKKKKSDQERPTQVLQLPKDPPVAIVAGQFAGRPLITPVTP